MHTGFLTGNLTLDLAISAWAIAQILKLIIQLAVHRTANWRTLLSSGGMPSSHSAFVCALAVSIGMLYGFSGPMFALGAGLAAIVMYDACNVRREAGEHAKVLNDLLEHIEEVTPERALKELLGHTPLQVLMGAVLGCIVGLVGPMVR